MEDASDPAVDETPVVRFINKVLMDAIRRGASDIHFEPYETYYRRITSYNVCYTKLLRIDRVTRVTT